MNICDKIVLFLGALMSSSLFAFHHMIPSPWNLIYVVLGCLMMPDAWQHIRKNQRYSTHSTYIYICMRSCSVLTSPQQMLLEAIFFLILVRHVPHKKEEKYHVSRVWARTTYGEPLQPLVLSRMRISGTKGGKGKIQDHGLIDERCASTL